MKPSLCLPLIALAISLPAVAGVASVEEATRRAEVTLPFADVRALLAAARPVEPPAPPPVAAVVTNARLTLRLGAKPATAQAEFDVDVLAPGWHVVPLLGAPFALAAITPADAAVTSSDGRLCLLARQPGRTHLVLAFEIPDARARAGEFALRFGPSTAGRLQIDSLPAGLRAEIVRDNFPSPDPTLPLPPDGGDVLVRLVEDRPVVPTAWRADVQTLLVAREDRIAAESRLRLTGDAGSGLGARLVLPPDAVDVRITGLDLQSARPTAGATELAWKTPDRLAREIIVRYDLPRPDGGEPWTVRPPQLADTPIASALTVIVAPPGVTLTAPGGRPVEKTDVLPEWMTAARAGVPALEVRATAPFVITSRAQPRLEVDTARITEARYATRAVADGARLCEARFRVQHRGPLRWRFSPPRGSELLTCEVAGRAANPLLLDRGELELLLPADDDAPRTTEVAFSYTERATAFAPVEGQLAVALPATPLFTETLLWSLALPDGYEATAFEGNVEPKGGGSEITFQKRLVRNEAASVEIYYRKRDTTR